jgi:hypothetical protein
MPTIEDVTAAVPISTLEDMMEIAGMVTTYWADQATSEEFARFPEAPFVIVEAYEERVIHPITYAALWKAYHDLLDLDQRFVNREIHSYFIDSWRNRDENGIDGGYIDGDAADVWVQVAIFGEVVYG